MSTNHVDRLDPALIRPGRVDMQLLLDNASVEQAEELFLRFFPESSKADEFSQCVGGHGISMAALQNHFFRYSNESDVISYPVAP